MKKKIGFLLAMMMLAGCQSPKDQKIEEQPVEEVSKKREEITTNLTNQDLTHLNEYLSELSQAGFLSYDSQSPDQTQLLDLGFMLYAFEGKIPDRVEVDGASYNPFPYEEFNKKLNFYFDCQLEKEGNDEWLFQEDTFYHPLLETGFSKNKVTQVDRVYDNGDGSLLVEGTLYRFKSSMEEDLYPQYVQPKSTWTSSMEAQLIGNVTVTFVQSEKLLHDVIDQYQANYFEGVEEEASDESQEVNADRTEYEEPQSETVEEEDHLEIPDERTYSPTDYIPAYQTDIFDYEQQPILTAGVVDYIMEGDGAPGSYTAILNIVPYSNDYPYTISLTVSNKFPQLQVGDRLEVYIVPEVRDIEESEGVIMAELQYFRYLSEEELASRF